MAAASSGPDILSRLPDELLLCIISILSMKDAVRTSVLSKRWHYLYASRSNIELCDNKGKLIDNDIISFLDRVFCYRDRCPINIFQISWGHQDGFDPLRLQGWINSVMWHGIRNIDIWIPANSLLPASLFTCETLVELRLSMESGPLLHVPAKVFLPSLVVLELTNVISFPYDDDASERLLTNCPVLEIEISSFHVFNLAAWYAQEESTASCLSFRLKRIDISSFHESDDEMDMVKYLLQSARVLEVLDVDTSDIESSKEQLEVCKRLRMLPIASSKCNVVIC